MRRNNSVGKRERMAGFTLVELITVMILVGILSVVAIPRMIDRTFDERGFHDAVKAAVQHARRVAVASRRYVCVTTTAGVGAAGILSIDIEATMPENAGANVACGAPVPLPSPGRECLPEVPNQVCAPVGVVLGGNSVIFDPLGRSVTAARAVQAAALTINVASPNQPGITIQPETGWVQ
jgi:MSHA pilin protein MshC